MKSLQFTFNRPVQGKLQFKALSRQPDAPHWQPFNTGLQNQLNVRTKDLEAGWWELILEWEHEEKTYWHTLPFEVKSQAKLFKTTRYADACLFHSRHPLHRMNN